MATGTNKSVLINVTGTGFEGRARRIRRCYRKGAAVQLRREPDNIHDRDAIAVYVRCNLLFGRWKPWVPIG